MSNKIGTTITSPNGGITAKLIWQQHNRQGSWSQYHIRSAQSFHVSLAPNLMNSDIFQPELEDGVYGCKVLVWNKAGARIDGGEEQLVLPGEEVGG